MAAPQKDAEDIQVIFPRIVLPDTISSPKLQLPICYLNGFRLSGKMREKTADF